MREPRCLTKVRSIVISSVFLIVVALSLTPGQCKGAAQLDLLHSFRGGATDGATPLDSLALSKDGRILYGMTGYGGSNGYGTIFKYDTRTAAFEILHNFNGATDGAWPVGSLTLSQDGRILYGMTWVWGSNSTDGTGTIFQYDMTTAIFEVLHSFTNRSVYGSWPVGSLTLSRDGRILYGMTLQGGSSDYGTIFQYDTTTAVFEVLHSFTGEPGDGASPYGSLTLSRNGAILYGMTYEGGGSDYGTIFQYDTKTATFEVLHSFTFGTTDGAWPIGSLTLSRDGQILYGMTGYGGSNERGTIFQYDTKTATFEVLHDFNGPIDGFGPGHSLALSKDGRTLYGMTRQGGSSYNDGTIFQYDTTTAIFEVLHSFTGEAGDGAAPYGSLSLSRDGAVLYGMTYEGGSNNKGVIFSLRR